jgi:PAS domain S-box-containing protein
LTRRIWLTSVVVAAWAAVSLVCIALGVWRIKEGRSAFQTAENKRRSVHSAGFDLLRSYARNVRPLFRSRNRPDFDMLLAATTAAPLVVPPIFAAAGGDSFGLADDMAELVALEQETREWSRRFDDALCDCLAGFEVADRSIEELFDWRAKQAARAESRHDVLLRDLGDPVEVERTTSGLRESFHEVSAWRTLYDELEDVRLVVDELRGYPASETLDDLRENRLVPTLGRLHQLAGSEVLRLHAGELQNRLETMGRALYGTAFLGDGYRSTIEAADGPLWPSLERYASLRDRKALLQERGATITARLHDKLAQIREQTGAASTRETARIEADVETIWHRVKLVAIVGVLILAFVCFRLPSDIRRQIDQVDAAFQGSREHAEALAESLVRTRAIFDQTFQLAGLLTLDGRVLDANRTALDFAGMTIDQVAGRLFWETPWWTHDAEQQAKVRDAVARAATGECVRFETHHFDVEGRCAYIDFSLKPARNDAGEIVMLIPEGRDITDRKLAETKLRESHDEVTAARAVAEEMAVRLELQNAELERRRRQAFEANRSKSEFLANMSHEIRTPMTAILGYADLLLDDGSVYGDAAHRAGAAQSIKRNADHLLEIVNDILDLSKVEAGKMVVERIDCSLPTVVNEVVALMQVQSQSKALALEVEWETFLPARIKTDPLRLKQILLNLLGNAIKFTELGSVRLAVRFVPRDPARIEIDVVDTGIGMSAAELSRLFRPFSQADSSTTRTFGGTGLGLTISKRFAQLLGGDVYVVESGAGRGTRFRIEIDPGSLDGVAMIRPDIAAAPSSQPADNAAATPKLHGKRILLAEDGPDNQRLIKFLLTKAGAEVTLAENGRVAVSTAKEAWQCECPFDVILMDMQMPELDGYGAATELRSLGYVGPIIALTAHAMSGDREKCLAAGCDDYATKPIDRRRLLEQTAEHAARNAHAAVRRRPGPSDRAGRAVEESAGTRAAASFYPLLAGR